MTRSSGASQPTRGRGQLPPRCRRSGIRHSLPLQVHLPRVDGLPSPHLSRDEHVAQPMPDRSARAWVPSSTPSPQPEAAEPPGRRKPPANGARQSAGQRGGPGVSSCVCSRIPFRALSCTFPECLRDSLKELRGTCSLESLSNKISKQTEQKFQPATTHYKTAVFPKAT